MKEELNEEFLDLRRFDDATDPIELIQSITSNPSIEQDAFYIANLEDICNKHINWITRLPRVQPHYAIKCNTDPMLLKLLAFLGTGFDCASKGEIQTILDLGISQHRIIFANPCKQASHVKYAYKKGVDHMTFDNEHELYKIKEHHSNAKIVLRIMTDDKDAVCRFSMKFGADLSSAYKLVKKAMELDLDLVGVSFHCGSGQMDPLSFRDAIGNARHLFDYARENFGCKMHLLDIGGGFPGDSNGTELFNSISKEINKSLDKFFPQTYFDELNGTDEKKLKIIAEPGRYYAASAFTLCINVIAKRTIEASGDQEEAAKMELVERASQTVSVNEMNSEVKYTTEAIDTSQSVMYYVNDGVYGSFNCLFYDHSIVQPILLGGKCQENKKLIKSSIWGPTCDGLDLINEGIYIPELEVGEFLAYKDMGAYTLSGAVAFNGIPIPKCTYIASTSWDTIKEAFTNTADEQITNMLKEVPMKSTCAAANLAFAKSSRNHQKSELLEEN